MRRFWIVACLLVLAALACGLPTTTVVVTATPPPTAAQPTRPAPTEEEPPDQAAPEETAAPAPTTGSLPAGPAEGTADRAWMGGFNCGVTLLDSDGTWFGWREETGPLRTDQITDIAVDSSGMAWIVDSLRISITDGASWTEASSSGADALAIDPISGDVWAVKYRTALMFDGTAWEEHGSGEFGSGEYVDLVKDVAVDAGGRAWVATTSSVAMYDGSAWTFWEEGAGFPALSYVSIEAIAAGSDGTIWVAHSSGVLRFDGTTWVNLDPGVSQPQNIAVSPDGQVWVASYDDGAAVYSGGGWTVYTRDNSGLVSNYVRGIAFDDLGRVWLGTTWGLSVFDGSAWASYTMDTSGLAGPCIDAIAVAGNGPPLPPPDASRVGSVTGLIVRGAAAVPDTRVVLCTEWPGMIFSGEHPCSDNTFSYQTVTDAEGRYTFTDIPVGEYDIVWQVPGEQWTSYLIGGDMIVVLAGELNEARTIDVTPR